MQLLLLVEHQCASHGTSRNFTRYLHELQIFIDFLSNKFPDIAGATRLKLSLELISVQEGKPTTSVINRTPTGLSHHTTNCRGRIVPEDLQKYGCLRLAVVLVVLLISCEKLIKLRAHFSENNSKD